MQTAAKETKRDQVVAQLFLNFVSLRDLFGVKTKLKDSIQEQQPNQYHFCN